MSIAIVIKNLEKINPKNKVTQAPKAIFSFAK
jgi:hypothetical protein